MGSSVWSANEPSDKGSKTFRASWQESKQALPFSPFLLHSATSFHSLGDIIIIGVSHRHCHHFCCSLFWWLKLRPNIRTSQRGKCHCHQLSGHCWADVECLSSWSYFLRKNTIKLKKDWLEHPLVKQSVSFPHNNSFTFWQFYPLNREPIFLFL